MTEMLNMREETVFAPPREMVVVRNVQRAIWIFMVAVTAIWAAAICMTPLEYLSIPIFLLLATCLAMVYLHEGLNRRLARFLAKCWLRPTDAAWMAEFEVQLARHYPGWEAFLKSEAPQYMSFTRFKQALEREWLDYKPDFPYELSMKASTTMREWAFEGHPNSYAKRWHFAYRDWKEVPGPRRHAAK